MIQLVENVEEKQQNVLHHHHKKSPFSFDDFLQNEIGFGKSQLYSMIGCSCTVMADGAQMMVIGLILPAIKLQMNLTDGQTDLLTSLIFTGFGLGGIFGDIYGRRKPYLVAALGQSICAFLSAIPFNFSYFVFMRAMFGFFCGITFSLNPTYTSQILPQQNRGQYYCIMTITFTIGELISVILAYFCMDSLVKGNWRALLLWSAFPTAIAFLICYFKMQESARYLLICRNNQVKINGVSGRLLGLVVLEEMMRSNGKDASQVQLIKDSILEWSEKESERQFNLQNRKGGDIRNLFRPSQQLLTTIKLIVIWFSLSFVFYGINFSLSTVVHKIREQQQQNEDQKTINDSMEDKKNIDFLGIFFTVLFQLPSSIIAAYVIEIQQFGRQLTLIYSYFICAISCLTTFMSSQHHDAFYFSITVSQFFINICFIIVFPFTSEIYSTIMRATGLGFHSAVCRVGGIIMPWIVLLFFVFGPTGPFLAFAVISLISGFASCFLPKDTVNSNLDQDTNKNNEVNVEQSQTQVQSNIAIQPQQNNQS